MDSSAGMSNSLGRPLLDVSVPRGMGVERDKMEWCDNPEGMGRIVEHDGQGEEASGTGVPHDGQGCVGEDAEEVEE